MDGGLLSTTALSTLFPHQERAIEQLRRSLAGGRRRPMLQLPTGAGKTVIAAHIVRGALDKGNRVMFCVPFCILIDQTVAAFEREGIFDIGVFQGPHPRTNPTALVQVASVQTLASREHWPEVDFVIVDEAHRHAQVIADWMEREPNTIFIGLSATPWAAGLGLRYNDLLVPATLQELIDDGLLSDFRAFAAAHPDLSNVPTNKKGDYDEQKLEEVMSDGTLVADVVETYLSKGEDRPAICFAVSRAHAQNLRDRFNAQGVPCGYIDAYTDDVERERIRGAFVAGKVKVVCNVGCLTTGVDWPVGCIILARPTKSEMLYVQMVGRGLRRNPRIEDCIILDHSDNTLRMGFVTDIRHAELSKDPRRDAAPERTAPLPKECKSCGFIKPAGVRECPNCGFKPEPVSQVVAVEGELRQIGGRPKQPTWEEKQAFYSGMLGIARELGRAPGWAAHAFRSKYGSWPNGFAKIPAGPTPEMLNHVKWLDIRYAKSRGRGRAA